MKLTDKEILRGHLYLKTLAQRAFRRGDINTAVHYVEKFCMVGNDINWMYHDEEMVQLVENIALQLHPLKYDTYTPVKRHVVFWDQYGISYVLALQYMRALIAKGYEVLYILSDYSDINTPTSILPELQASEKVTVEIIPEELNLKERIERVGDLTESFCPEKLFLHVRDNSVFNYVMPLLPECCTSYYINQHDHAYWIKNSNLDYVIPYRVWGAVIDKEKRGFRDEQILQVPYYPIITEAPFAGFPDGLDDSCIIFTGGTFFKTLDRDNTYWSLLIQMLVENPNAIVLYAIKGGVSALQTAAIEKYAKGQNVADRLIPIGFRPDINEVFKHCDIFFGTCPMSGGLMSQYAAVNSKPILQYYRPDMATNNETEQVLNYNDEVEISFTDKRKFLDEAKHLINDAAYRKEKGEALHRCLITQKQFDDLLEKTIETNKNQVPITPLHIDYDVYTDWWLSMEANGISHVSAFLRSELGRMKYLVMPISSILSRLKKKVNPA